MISIFVYLWIEMIQMLRELPVWMRLNNVILRLVVVEKQAKTQTWMDKAVRTDRTLKRKANSEGK